MVPQDKLEEVLALLPKLKAADDDVLSDVVGGMDLKKSFGMLACACSSYKVADSLPVAIHPDHYTHFH